MTLLSCSALLYSNFAEYEQEERAAHDWCTEDVISIGHGNSPIDLLNCMPGICVIKNKVKSGKNFQDKA